MADTNYMRSDQQEQGLSWIHPRSLVVRQKYEVLQRGNSFVRVSDARILEPW